MGAINTLLSIFPLYTFNASSSFSVDWDGNQSIVLLCYEESTVTYSLKWLILSQGSGNGPIAALGNHLQLVQIHTNLQTLTYCSLLFYLSKTDPPLYCCSILFCAMVHGKMLRQLLWPSILAPAFYTEASWWLTLHAHHCTSQNLVGCFLMKACDHCAWAEASLQPFFLTLSTRSWILHWWRNLWSHATFRYFMDKCIPMN